MDVNTEVVLLRKVVKAQDQAAQDAQTIQRLEADLYASKIERDQLHDDILELKDKVEAAETRVQSLQHAARVLSPASSSARATKSPARKVIPQADHSLCKRKHRTLEKENKDLKDKLDHALRQLAKLEHEREERNRRKKPSPSKRKSGTGSGSRSKPKRPACEPSTSSLDEDEDDHDHDYVLSQFTTRDPSPVAGASDDEESEEEQQQNTAEDGSDEDEEKETAAGSSRRRSRRLRKKGKDVRVDSQRTLRIRDDSDEDEGREFRRTTRRIRKRSRTPESDEGEETELRHKSPSSRRSDSQKTIDEEDEDKSAEEEEDSEDGEDEDDDDGENGELQESRCARCEAADIECRVYAFRKACRTCASVKHGCYFPPTTLSFLDLQASDDVCPP